MEEPEHILFLCTHNSARSQMAEGLLRHLGKGRFRTFSAGTEATRVRPEAIEVMAELGVDISSAKSKTLERFLQDPFDLIITVCDGANEVCPVFPRAKKRLHWSIDDPAGVIGKPEEVMTAFRKARDELKARIESEILPTTGE